MTRPENLNHYRPYSYKELAARMAVNTVFVHRNDETKSTIHSLKNSKGNLTLMLGGVWITPDQLLDEWYVAESKLPAGAYKLLA